MLGGRPRPADDGPPADQRQSAASGSRPRVSTLATLAGAVLRLQGLGEGLCLGVCSLVVNPYIHGIGRVLSGGKALHGIVSQSCPSDKNRQNQIR